MCGIAGYIGNRKFKKSTVQSLLKIMKKRGPDHQKYLKKKIKKKIFSNFFFSRLSIIDTKKRSHQPFKYKNLTLIFNGEIYNYKELKILLKRRGYKFSTSSDTEVLIKSIHCWGFNSFKKFEGMWAIAYYDSLKNKTFLCRDRFGEKPLLYTLKNDEIYFGSEIKFIKKLINFKLTINFELIRKFLSFGYRTVFNKNHTFFNEIKILNPSSCMEINHNNNEIKERKYWTAKSIKIKKIRDEKIIIKKTKEKILESLKIRLRSDVPIAFLLSGGVDSSVLTYFSKKILNYNVKTFSVISADNLYDERKNIIKSIKNLNVDHEFINLSYKKINFLKQLKQMQNEYCQPLITLTSMLNWNLMNKIRKKNYKVCISGIGGDELFSGYYHHNSLMINYLKNFKKRKNFLKNWKNYTKPYIRNKLINRKTYNTILNKNKFLFQYQDFKKDLFLSNNHDFLKNFKEYNITKDKFRNRLLNEMFFEVVPTVLYQDDLNAMNFSIENRSPFLDTQILKMAMQIPSEKLIQNGFGKWILRNVGKNTIPNDIIFDRKKVGFNLSLNTLIKNQKNEIYKLLKAESQIYKIINKKRLLKFFKNTKLFKGDENNFIFNVISVKLFLKKYENSIV
tara:strand:- start:2274 stop:4133 length:1860 start_codon:yes stop_codon:yes gene_type:complete